MSTQLTWFLFVVACVATYVAALIEYTEVTLVWSLMVSLIGYAIAALHCMWWVIKEDIYKDK